MKVESIDTRHGSLNQPSFSNGNTLPYTGTPFGMNYFIIQSQSGNSWHFDPTYPIIQGFRLTHQPSPWMGDYSWMLFTPITGKPSATNLHMLQSSYKESEAIFNPHKLYAESMRYRLKTRIIPTKRGAKFQIENSSSKGLGLVLSTENNTEYRVDNENKRLYAVIKQPLNDDQNTLKQYLTLDFNEANIDQLVLQTFNNEQWEETTTEDKQAVWLEIKTEQKKVRFSLGTSFISATQAELNLDREVLNASLEDLEEKSANEWEYYLNKIQVKDRNQQKAREFNQYMYRMFLFPQTYYEWDENDEAIHFDSYSESVKPGKFFTNNGYWDTYRTVYPLYSLIIPEIYQDILEGIKNFYIESGHLPKWLSPDERGLMPGTLINAVIADAAVKGLLDEEDMQFFLDAMIKEANTPPTEAKFGRAGVSDMLKYGYVTDKHIESVNQTQDNAYSDFCIKQVASMLEADDIAEEYSQKALNYRHLFDAETGFLRGKNEAGEFTDPFVPEDWHYDYTEGSAWQNALAFYHDTQGYIDLLGGKDVFLDHLVALANEKPIFEIGNYGMEIHEMSEIAVADFGQIGISNQPSFHIPYLYSYAGKPEYTQHIVKQLSTHAFSTDFDGFPGDEDNGSMSGWFIFSHLGFYPVTPGTNEYVLGIPQFDEMTIHLPDEKKFTIQTEGNRPNNSFVKTVEINEKTVDKLYITHEEIMAGGEMFVELSMLPPVREYTKDQLPYSLTNDQKEK